MNDPANQPDDNGLRQCRECGNDIKIDMYDPKLAEVEEFNYCFEHLTDPEEIRAEAQDKAGNVAYYKKRAKAYKELYSTTEKDAAALRERVKELESRLRYKESLIQELHEGICKLEEIAKREI
jgi:hypothetical protein